MTPSTFVEEDKNDDDDEENVRTKVKSSITFYLVLIYGIIVVDSY